MFPEVGLWQSLCLKTPLDSYATFPLLVYGRDYPRFGGSLDLLPFHAYSATAFSTSLVWRWCHMSGAHHWQGSGSDVPILEGGKWDQGVLHTLFLHLLANQMPKSLSAEGTEEPLGRKGLSPWMTAWSRGSDSSNSSGSTWNWDISQKWIFVRLVTEIGSCLL